jgi:ElaA protein
MENNITWKIKPFADLSLSELYSILELRSLVFVVEQNCVYQDIDNKDQKALHLMGEIDGKLVAYARLFDAGIYFENTSIGRVIVHPEARAQKLGHQLIQKAIEQIKRLFDKEQITISAQLYLQKFYESHGFIQTSDVYLEDDIPHIEMKIE